MTEKNQRTIRTATSPAVEARLLALPDVLMEQARREFLQSPRAAASVAMRAVAIAFLTRLPIRLQNLRTLRIGQHLQRADPKRSTITSLSIPANETKNRRPILMPVLPDLGRLLDEWSREFRPCFAAPRCTYLFPSFTGKDAPITPQGLRDAITKATHEHAGVKLSPHQFRHLAANLVLDAHPGEYETARQLLGHASLQTTVRAYAGIEQEASARRYDEVLAARRMSRRTTTRGAKKARTR